MAAWSVEGSCSAPEDVEYNDEDSSMLQKLLEDAYEAQTGDGEVCE